MGTGCLVAVCVNLCIKCCFVCVGPGMAVDCGFTK